MKKRFLVLISLLLTAVFALSSCGDIGRAASELAGAVVSSVNDELTGALSEGSKEINDGLNGLKEGFDELKGDISDIKGEISDGINDIKDGFDSAKDNIGNAGSIISEKIGDVTDRIIDQINSGISEAADNIAPTTSASSCDTTSVPTEDREYKFRTQKLFDDHFEKHGSEFGNITQEKYLELANELIHSTSDKVLHKRTQRDDGDKSYDSKFFDTETGYFLVLSEDGYIRTFFIPSAGINYWNRQ